MCVVEWCMGYHILLQVNHFEWLAPPSMIGATFFPSFQLLDLVLWILEPLQAFPLICPLNGFSVIHTKQTAKHLSAPCGHSKNSKQGGGKIHLSSKRQRQGWVYAISVLHARETPENYTVRLSHDIYEKKSKTN